MILKRLASFSTKKQLDIVDLAPFLHGNTKDKQIVADKVAKCCKDIGFLYIKNHGIPK